MAGVLGETLVGVGDETLDRLRGEAPAVARGEMRDAGRQALIGQDRRRRCDHGNPSSERRDASPRYQPRLVSAGSDVKISAHADVSRH
jgi:hypothetical protein